MSSELVRFRVPVHVKDKLFALAESRKVSVASILRDWVLEHFPDLRCRRYVSCEEYPISCENCQWCEGEIVR